ncbi:EVE domain-containing protein [Marinobacterium rhizophilum]|uniref:EVE domain-containing protein n=1 Tax=Marinobacterium rhizophilum TaxID=420402 RepID=A0ABY5HN74_9GAMM|nr:EVE domain-containing protein [Marinobacterium rhizophilum]UTW13888.1 EVE domain-containing protein [Marinobacterium rhizophilum]
MQCWLFKTEPDLFGIEDLARAADQTARWDEIRNYQARNFLRDDVKVGDQVFIYHSSCKAVGIAGLAEVVRAAYPDPSQFDPSHALFDAKAVVGSPRWFCVDVRLRQRFSDVIPLRQLKAMPELAGMTLLRQGRLSVQPVSDAERRAILGIL